MKNVSLGPAASAASGESGQLCYSARLESVSLWALLALWMEARSWILKGAQLCLH